VSPAIDVKPASVDWNALDALVAAVPNPNVDLIVAASASSNKLLAADVRVVTAYASESVV
jgi:hypothetical protein